MAVDLVEVWAAVDLAEAVEALVEALEVAVLVGLEAVVVGSDMGEVVADLEVGLGELAVHPQIMVLLYRQTTSPITLPVEAKSATLFTSAM